MKDLKEKIPEVMDTQNKDNVQPGCGGEHYPRFSVEVCNHLMTAIIHNMRNKVPLNCSGVHSYAHASHMPLFFSALGRNKSSSLEYLWLAMGIYIT